MRPHRLMAPLAAGACVLLFCQVLAIGPALAKSSIGIGSGEVTPTPTSGLMGVYFAWITTYQREFFTALRHALIALRSDGTALPFLVGLSFVYGVFHAAGPGHGKAVISSYIVANKVQLKRGIALSFAASMVQAITAIVVVGAGWFLLRGTSVSMTDASDALEIISYALVALFGAWLLTRKLIQLARLSRLSGGWRFDAGFRRPFRGLFRRRSSGLDDGMRLAFGPAGGVASAGVGSLPGTGGNGGNGTLVFAAPALQQRGRLMRPASTAIDAGLCTDDGDDCGCGREHMPDPKSLGGTMTLGTAASAVLAIGLRPCSGAIVVLTFALVNGLYLAGLLSVFAMALGTAITVSSIAAVAVFAKGFALRLSGDGRGGIGFALISALEIAGALVLLLVGIGLLGGALQTF